MILFLSNHTDLEPIQRITGEEVKLLKHPYVMPEWTTEELIKECKTVIEQAVNAENLVMNGDYTLVAIILRNRLILDKKTGFLTMKKIENPVTGKDARGVIKHSNVLLPVGIRWV